MSVLKVLLLSVLGLLHAGMVNGDSKLETHNHNHYGALWGLLGASVTTCEEVYTNELSLSLAGEIQIANDKIEALTTIVQSLVVENKDMRTKLNSLETNMQSLHTKSDLILSRQTTNHETVVEKIDAFASVLADKLLSMGVLEYEWMACVLIQTTVCLSAILLFTRDPFRLKVGIWLGVQLFWSTLCYYFIHRGNDQLGSSGVGHVASWVFAFIVLFWTSLSSIATWYICRIPVVVVMPTSVPAQGPVTTATAATQSTALTVPTVPAVPTAAVVVLGTQPIPTPAATSVATDEPKLSYRETVERRVRFQKSSFT